MIAPLPGSFVPFKSDIYETARTIFVSLLCLAILGSLAWAVWASSQPRQPPQPLLYSRFTCMTPDGTIAHDVWWWEVRSGDVLRWTTGVGDYNQQTLRRPYSCSSVSLRN